MNAAEHWKREVTLVEDPKLYYSNKADELQIELEKLEGVCRLGGVLRGISFLLTGVCFFTAFFQLHEPSSLWWALFGLCTVGFLAAVMVHARFEAQRLEKSLWVSFFKQGIARIDRDWQNLASPKTWLLSNEHLKVTDLFESFGQPARELSALDRALITDLDLEGENSLWRLINLARTQLGQETLSRWMMEASLGEQSQQRQAAVKSLAAAEDWRHNFLLCCWNAINPISSPSSITRWAIGPKPEPWLRAMIRVAQVNVLIFFAILVGGFTGWLSVESTGTALAILVGANFLISVLTAGTVHEIFRRVGARASDVAQYRFLLQMIETAPSNSPLVDKLKQQLQKGLNEEIASHLTQNKGEGVGYYRPGMDRLVFWSSLSNIRSGIFFPVYVVLQFGFLWDLHLLDRLENWRTKWGRGVPVWFNVLGQCEALASVAQFRFEHPNWVFPEIHSTNNDAKSVISGTTMGHPVLGPKSVTNDLNLGPFGSTLLVTGSNMSGKSTYLRAVGVNLILGRIGAPVFAQQFQMPAVTIGSSMRVADSLSEGISFFMSELQRLKQIVDRAKEFSTQSEMQFVFLLDEILQGTNSQERQIAVTRVVRQLLAKHAVGALSTHDLQLPEVPELKGQLEIVHFKESFQTIDGKQQMTFDYKMRPGMTPTTNALKLLALVGLDDQE